MARIGPMTSPKFLLSRRDLMAGLGAAGLATAWPSTGFAQAGRPVLQLEGKAESLQLRPGAPATPVWGLGEPDLKFKRGDIVEVGWKGITGVSPLAKPNWRGVDGAPDVEPLPAGLSKVTKLMPLRHAGTFHCDLELLSDGQRPSRSYALVVQESEAVAVDRDEMFLIEDWRIRPDGTGASPGSDPADAMRIHTINGKASFDLSARRHDRVRLRLINGSQRSVIAIKLEGVDVKVMAIDSQPSEPFQARNGALVLAPGGRADVFVDLIAPEGTTAAILLHDGKEARRVGGLVVSGDPPIRPAPLPPAPPLPSNDLPERIELKGATRVDLALGDSQGEWVAPTKFNANAPPAFRAKRGRTVVLALTNRAAIATVFHLHGHHFRLLDKLDDGWKPFWLDTLAIEPGQTQRIAFLAEHAGRYLIESVATDWAAPRLVRWYAVE
ncbi:multicopper oxidase family protein [Bradyrhizobium paxllaeri]|uniref:multicopper oxidase family protein n=1 Tax=Bradyrhizobium paxllaeri TaxID=190148 RepID=UPI000A6C4C06|nr:multicopper oxidase domain-containing protein [Bradyrhizobium paxllaeri]